MLKGKNMRNAAEMQETGENAARAELSKQFSKKNV